jgi:hypothetical protein
MRTASASCVLAFASFFAFVACSSDPATSPITPGGAGMSQAGGGSGSGGGGAAGAAAGGSASGSSTGGASAGGGTGGAGGSSAGMAGAGGSGGAAGGAAGSGGSGGGAACVATTGKALQFKSGVIDIAAGDLGDDLAGGNGPRTIELWAKFTSAASWKAEGSVIEMGRKLGPANQVFGIDMADRTSDTVGKFDPYTNGVGDNDPTPVTAPVMGWHHLAWSYDGAGKFQFVVDGVKITIPHPDAGTTMLDTTKGIFTLGASQSFGTQGWEGVMDEVRVWSIARAEADIKRDMKVKLKGSEAGLVAYWNLDEGTGETADDIKKAASHQLKFCTANGGACPALNAAKPMWVDSDAPGPFSCAP